MTAPIKPLRPLRPYGAHPPTVRPFGFNMRLSAEEFDRFEAKAAAAGLTRSAWIREMIGTGTEGER